MKLKKNIFRSSLETSLHRQILLESSTVVKILTHLVPQACYHEPALRRAYITLGALHVAQAQELPNSLVQRNRNTREVYEYALQQYQKAIIAMRGVKIFERH